MGDIPTNMRILNRSRKRRQVGEIFVFSMREGEYYWGRVIALDFKLGGFENVTLCYIYNTKSSCTIPIPPLDKNNLLIPPFGINNLPWSKGRFETVTVSSLTEDELLKPHCFWDIATNKYFDGRGNELSEPCNPVGVYALSSYRTVDDRTSKVLGIPLVPD